MPSFLKVVLSVPALGINISYGNLQICNRFDAIREYRVEFPKGTLNSLGFDHPAPQTKEPLQAKNC